MLNTLVSLMESNTNSLLQTVLKEMASTVLIQLVLDTYGAFPCFHA